MLSFEELADMVSLRSGASTELSADTAEPDLPFGAIPRDKYLDNGKNH
jgi:hypothetical protein